MSFDDRTQASFDAASEAVKQLLTLATGSIGAAIALFDGEAAGVTFGSNAGWVKGGLIGLAASVLFGLFSLGTIAGQLGADAITKPSTYAQPLRLFHMLQMAGFGSGILLLVVAILL